ncbi:DUF3086 domain-containing protein [soil metagenome]|uniref:DUF3086 domain-containing protein n=1 Tax=Leptolyngbya sp. BC1307 TaxID=2029589 RepID=UPI000EFBB468|nr:DUF3086 domain-containing protein [Leptolyngbya sp. BC1307]
MPPEDTPYENSEAASGETAPPNAETANAETAPTSRTPLELQRDRSRSSSLTSGQPLRSPSAGAQADVDQMVRQGLQELESKRRDLQREIEQLERRKERIAIEMRSSFAGVSQDIAIRVQGFKEYLAGSLQDLASAAEQMDIAPIAPEPVAPATPVAPASEDTEIVPLAAQRFAEQRDRISSLLDQYRTRPDYYGPPWQLRRTFEPVHADRVSNWFFTQAGRGAVKSMGSRLQNVLVASAAISCLYSIYDRRLCVLVLATTPERLGEWRRWLQDCLGIARADFGTNRGVMLFEASEPMTQRAERLMDSGRIPFLVMDEAEDKVSLSLLQFPLWLGFAPDPANPSTDYDYY